jgi:hypothetical protein
MISFNKSIVPPLHEILRDRSWWYSLVDKISAFALFSKASSKQARVLILSAQPIHSVQFCRMNFSATLRNPQSAIALWSSLTLRGDVH